LNLAALCSRFQEDKLHFFGHHHFAQLELLGVKSIWSSFGLCIVSLFGDALFGGNLQIPGDWISSGEVVSKGQVESMQFDGLGKNEFHPSVASVEIQAPFRASFLSGQKAARWFIGAFGRSFNLDLRVYVSS
jgi:hypothetical protein